jgi:hypothetical protein
MDITVLMLGIMRPVEPSVKSNARQYLKDLKALTQAGLI